VAKPSTIILGAAAAGGDGADKAAGATGAAVCLGGAREDDIAPVCDDGSKWE